MLYAAAFSSAACSSGGKALPYVTISSTISSTFLRRRWNDEPATRNDNVNDTDVK